MKNLMSVRFDLLRFGKLLSLLSICFCAFLPSAQAIDISGFGAMSYSNPIFSPSLTTTGGISFGFGGTIGVGLLPLISVEAGAMYLPHSFSATVATGTVNATYKSYTLPILVRFSPISLISINAGAYYGLASSTDLTFTSLAGAVSSSSGANVNDAGLMAGVSVRFPILPLFKIRGDIMYEYGLVNLANSVSGVSPTTTSQYSRNLDFLLGLMFSL